MRIKKVLSLAVVLAMVLTVVPMFGLTASAEESSLVYDSADAVLKGWGKTHATVNFTPITGNATITFDVTYNTNVMATDDPGAFFIGLGQGSYTGYGNVPSFGDSAIGLQPHGSKNDTFKLAFRNGGNWSTDVEAELNTTYSVTIETDTVAHTYTASMTKKDGGNEVLATTDALAYRYTGADTLDTFMIFRNGSNDAEEEDFKVENLKINGTPADVYNRDGDITEDDLKDKNGMPYQIVKADGKAKNLIFNGDFSYGTAGWTNGAYSLLNTEWFPISDNGDKTKALKDSHAESSDGSASTSSIGTRWAIQGGKTYIFVIDMMKETNANNNGGIWFFDASGNKLNPTADNCLSTNIVVTSNGDGLCETGDFLFNNFTANEWVTKKYLLKAPDNATTIQFCNAWSSNTWVDNAALYEIERIEAQKITVNYQADGVTVKSVENVEVPNDATTYTPDANMFLGNEGKWYTTGNEPAAVEIADGKADVALTELKAFTVQKGNLLTNDVTDNHKYKGYDTFAAMNWGDAGTHDRMGIAILDVDTSKENFVLDGTQVRWHINDGNNDAVTFYAISVDTFKNIDLTDVNETDLIAAMIDGNKVAGIEKDSGNDQDEKKVQIVLDAAKIKAAAGQTGKVVLLADANHTLYGIAAEGLQILSVDTPTAPTPELGFDSEGGKFFINFKANSESDNLVVTPEKGDAQTFTGSVTVDTANTNRIFTAVTTAAEAAAIKSEEEAASIYSLVVAALKDATGVAKDKQDAINKVIATGGIYLSEANSLPSDVTNVLTYDNDTKVVTVDGTIFSYGIGFTATNGNIVVGNEAKEVAPDTVDSGVAAVYQYMKIDIEGSKVTLSNDSSNFETQDAVTLSLDSVNIEFVETLIEELEANGVDADVNFVPEL